MSKNTLKRVFSNAGLLLGGRGIAGVLGLLSTALCANSLGAYQFGILVLIHAYMMTLSEMTSFKSWQAVIRYGANCLATGERGHFQGLIKFCVLLDFASAIFGTLLAMALIPLVASLFGLEKSVNTLAAFYCLVIVFRSNSTATGILRLFDRFDSLTRHSLILPVLRLIGVSMAYLFNADLEIFLLAWFFAALISGAIIQWMGWWELKRQNLTNNIQWGWRGLAEPHAGLWSFVWTANIQSTLSLAGTQLATLVVGAILGPASAALFKIAQEAAGVITKPTRTLTRTLYPELAKITSSLPLRRQWALIMRSGAIAGIVAIAIVCVIAIYGPWLLGSLFGEEFVAAYDVLMLLLIAAVIGIFLFPLEPALYAQGRPGILLNISLGESVLMLLATWVLLEYMALPGAGIAAIFSRLLGGVLLLWKAGQLFRHRETSENSS